MYTTSQGRAARASVATGPAGSGDRRSENGGRGYPAGRLARVTFCRPAGSVYRAAPNPGSRTVRIRRISPLRNLPAGAPGGIRTPDPRFRRPMLYPLSYERAQTVYHGLPGLSTPDSTPRCFPRMTARRVDDPVAGGVTSAWRHTSHRGACQGKWKRTKTAIVVAPHRELREVLFLAEPLLTQVRA